MKTIYVLHYDIVKRGEFFFLTRLDSHEDYLLISENWEDAEEEAKRLKERLKELHPNCIIAIN